MYVVVRGLVKVLVGGQVVRELGEMELIGESHVLDTDVNQATFVTAEEAVLYKLDKDKFYALLSKEYEMINGLLNIIDQKYAHEHDAQSATALA